MLESDQSYEPGDHLAIYPDNDTTMVNTILKRLNPDPGPDEPIVVEYRNETGKRILIQFSVYYGIWINTSCSPGGVNL